MSKLTEHIGNANSSGDNQYQRRERLHQGWWRAFVLNEEEGLSRHGNKYCNYINNGKESENNFLTGNSKKSLQETISEREEISSGMFREQRLYNNLLSSQPLCFNFFGEFKIDKDLALGFLKQYIPDATKVIDIKFEWISEEGSLDDNSAFDIAFIFRAGKRKGFFGLECKYTDDFTYENKKTHQFYGAPGNKNYEKYTEIFKKTKDRFKAQYPEYVESKKYNQLFRNQLMAEKAVSNGEYDMAYTGLFTKEANIHRNLKSVDIAREFQEMVVDGEKIFKIITYKDFVENIQKLELSWEQREWAMLLWIRYMALQLSENIVERS